MTTPSNSFFERSRMSPVHVEVSRHIAAPSSHIFSILSDYRVGHPRILPRGIESLTVERGGRGAGTVIRFRVRSFGTVWSMRASVDEPVPGRVLLERSLDGGSVETRFTVDPAEGGGSRVTIETSWMPRGPRALLERLVGPFLLERAFAEELDNLALVAAGELRDA